MLGKIPITTLDDLGSINNINLLQLNNMFSKLYLNDAFYKNLYDKIPKVYQNGKVYNENDCVWFNTEYYREFIDFPLHAKHIVDDYNASPRGMIQSNLSLDYNEPTNKIIISSQQNGSITSVNLDYDDKNTCLSLMHYSYALGDLTDSNGNINNSILYKCNFNNISAWVDLDNEILPLRDRLSVGEDENKNEISVVRTFYEYKDVLNYENSTYPVWSVVYSNASEINYAWVSAYCRAALSVHAMTISARVVGETGIERTVAIPNTIELGKLQAFPGKSDSNMISTYVPGYETNGYSISPINEHLMSVDIIWDKTKTPHDPISANTKIGYYKKDQETLEFNKSLIYNESTSSDNVFFQHNVPNVEQREEIEKKYVSIDTFNIDLTSIWTCYSKSDLHVKFNFDIHDNLSKTFDCIIFSSGNLRTDMNINIWASGLVEAYGKTNSYSFATFVNGIDIDSVRIRFEGKNEVQLTSTTESNTSFYISEYQSVSSLIPTLSSTVPCINAYVVDYIEKDD